VTTQSEIRLLFLNHVSQISGAEVGLLDLVRSLDRKRFPVVVVVPAAGPLTDALEKNGAKVVHLRLRRFVKTLNPFRWISYLISLSTVVPRLVRLIREERIDIVHSNSTTAQIYGVLAARRAAVPSIWHCRDLVNLGLLGRWLYRSSTRIIAISHAVAEHLNQNGHNDKLVTIHNGVDLPLLQPTGVRDTLRKELGIGPDALLVAMAGQMVPWKNHALFLRAASLIAEELPTARFLIIGDDLFGGQSGYRDRLKGLARELELTESVRFLGYRTDFARLLEGIDVLVHPADREPFGRVIAEAMAMAKPVVAINAGGPTEIIHDGQDGLLIPPNNPVELAKAVIRLKEEPALASRLAQEARKRIETDFNLEKHRSSIQTLYEATIVPNAVAQNDTGRCRSGQIRLAYIVGQFPSLSETFILREIVALRNKGFDMLIFSLNRPSSSKIHAEAVPLLSQVRYPSPFPSGRLIHNHYRVFCSAPSLYCREAVRSMLHGPAGVRRFRLAADFAAEARRLHIDHLHAHFAFMPTDVAMIMACLLKRPFSFSAHAQDIFTQNAAALARKAAPAAFVTTCSQHGYKYLRKNLPALPADKIVMIHHGIDPTRFLPVNSAKPRILAVGRLEEKKGFAYLLRACGKMTMKGVDFSCTILGTGSLEDKLEEELLRCNASGSVVLHGEATQEELQEFFNAAQVLVVPSVLTGNGDRDGIPNVILEAMAMKIPIVATTTGAIHEAVTDGENGLLVPPADPDALADAIERLLADRGLRQRLGEAGRTRVLNQFDISKNIETLAGLFQRISGRNM
jgi:glycosyltransferase involved in cell wall biosynthesis